MAKKTSTQALGFEEQIWSAADKLRGNIDASEYKNVVLGLIFLKYISDKFDQKYQELVEEGEGFEEDRDEYASENIFFVPESARWKTIAAAAHTPEIGKAIDEAMRQIEAENNKLKGILPKNFARQELDKRRLGEVVDLFTNVKMAEKGDSRDILGRTYEYCLAKFAEAEGKNAGEFYTPACVVKTLVEVIEPYHGRVYDPCCGSGGMFVQSADFVKRHQGNINDISVYGQESNPTTWKMATMNLAIRGIDADLGDHNADTFFEDLHKTDMAAAEYIKAHNRRYQDYDNYVWVRDAEKNKLVVGTQCRILYQDAMGRMNLALKFNEMVRNGEIGPVILGRDHHDTGGTDAPFRETSNIKDGSNIMAEMATQCYAGNAARGMSLIALHNGGGTGIGRAINGGFGMVIDGSEDSARHIKEMLLWDVNNGIARRSWARNEGAMFAIKREMERTPGLKVTLPNLADDKLVRKAIDEVK